jgi:hypothetical protein
MVANCKVVESHKGAASAEDVVTENIRTEVDVVVHLVVEDIQVHPAVGCSMDQTS